METQKIVNLCCQLDGIQNYDGNAEQKDMKNMYCLVRKECVQLTGETSLKAAVIIKEISTMEKKPGIFALQKQKES